MVDVPHGRPKSPSWGTADQLGVLVDAGVGGHTFGMSTPADLLALSAVNRALQCFVMSPSNDSRLWRSACADFIDGITDSWNNEDEQTIDWICQKCKHICRGTPTLRPPNICTGFHSQSASNIWTSETHEYLIAAAYGSYRELLQWRMDSNRHQPRFSANLDHREARSHYSPFLKSRGRLFFS
jgi:hypothetical protein